MARLLHVLYTCNSHRPSELDLYLFSDNCFSQHKPSVIEAGAMVTVVFCECGSHLGYVIRNVDDDKGTTEPTYTLSTYLRAEWNTCCKKTNKTRLS